MDTTEDMFAALAVVADDELDDSQRMVELFLRQGWMDELEAERWRQLIRGRRVLAEMDEGKTTAVH